MSEKAIIGLDYSHNNFLTLEASSFAEFTQFLFNSGYKIGKIESGFNSLPDLGKYKTILLSTPRNTHLKEKEIENLVEYVKNGGGLLITSSTGGDYSNSTNLNALTRNFGFEFLPNEINDSVSYVHLQKRPILTTFKAHVITEGINKLVFSSSCSTKILDFLEDGENIKIESLLTSGLNSWHRLFDGEEWLEEDLPKTDLLVAVDYYDGKVVAFGNISIFSSLAREYGFTAFDNDILIANILNWLIGSIESEGKPVTVELNLDLFYWIEGIVKENKWENFSDLINISLKYFKDHYKEIMAEVEQKKLDKLERRKEYEEAEKKEIIEKKEEEVFEKVPVQERKKEDLEEIMKSLEELTGEHYEISIDLDGQDEIKIADSSLSYTSEDVEEFEQGNPKKAIWHGKATKAFVEWLVKKYQ
ncbi:MAG: Gldg family protein [Promethearchaeota archaeon]|jgi:Arc/MetJ-type ribon-helix-helix transcriptional regulator